MKIFIIPIFFICCQSFISCKENSKMNKEIVSQTIDENISVLSKTKLMYFEYIRKMDDQNPGKVGRYFRAAEKIRLASDITRKYIELISLEYLIDNNVEDSILSFKLKINNILDSFQNVKNEISIDSILNLNLISTKRISLEDHKFISKIYINKILLVENIIIRELAGQVSSSGHINFIKMHVFKDCSKIRVGEIFSATIVPTYINTNERFVFSVNQILRNGRKINLKIEKFWYEGMGLVKIKPNEEGNYVFTGRVYYNNFIGDTLSYPFQGDFIVEE